MAEDENEKEEDGAVPEDEKEDVSQDTSGEDSTEEETSKSEEPLESNKRAIVIDDSAFMRKVLTDRLKDAGVDVIGTAGDGVEGLKLFIELKPDLVFIDILMPGIDGLETLKEIKKQDLWAKAVIVTAVDPKDAKERAEELGASAYLNKPIDKDKLKEILNRI